MPELPEVETIVRTLAPQVVGRTVSAAHVLLPKTLETGRDLLRCTFPGACITTVRRRGKLLLMDITSSGASFILAFHLKMTGRLFVHPADTAPHKHTRMVFDLAATETAPAAFLFFDDMRTFGYCRLMRAEHLPAWPFWAKLGPEPLTLSDANFCAALNERRCAVKALLLNQTVIAGIGNIYADEACFRSAIHPATPAQSLTDGQKKRLLGNIQAVLLESIAECGSSIRDYRDANGDAGAFQNMFRVYGRAGMACTVCGATLEKTVVGGRGTVFCTKCQPVPLPSALVKS